MDTAPLPNPGDPVRRRTMFALELVDPLSGLSVTRGMAVVAAGYGRPRIVSGGRFVWLLDGAPAQAHVKVTATAADGRYRPFEEVLPVPAAGPGVKPESLGFRRVLTSTGLNLPPPGITTVAGMLLDDGDPPNPLADVKVRIQATDLGGTFTTAYEGLSDVRGGFVAAAPDLSGISADPAPMPSPEGAIVGWLRIGEGSSARFTTRLALQPGRLLTLREPLKPHLLPTQPP